MDTPSPRREVLHEDAVAWLQAHPAVSGASLVTSLPDVAEVGLPDAAWHNLFVTAAGACLDAVPDTGIAVFFQTDNRVDGRHRSKAALLLQAAATREIPLLWHKVVLRHPPGTKTLGRPGYSHLLAFSRTATLPPERSTPDVLADRGALDWSHGMGRAPAEVAITTIRAASPDTRLVLAPFCGLGVVLTVANDAGLDALGIERNRKRADRARRLAT